MTSLVMPASLVHGQENTKPEPKKEAVEPAQPKEEKETTDEAAPGTPSILDRIIADEIAKTPAPVTASTTVAATTTPVIPSPEDRTNTTPGDEINKEAEEVLNTNLKPETPAPAKSVKPKPTPTSVASTTPAGTTDPVEPTIDGSSHSFSPNNYYIPLDNLSPEMTYALSFVAMILGISGAFLIIRDPRARTAPAGTGEWVPAPAGFTREAILEP